jgi:hypothetical protein
VGPQLAVAAIIFAAVFTGVRRRLRRSGYDAWAPKWKAVNAKRRRRIERAVRRAEAMSDPQDAALAVELIDRNFAPRLGLRGSRLIVVELSLFAFLFSVALFTRDFTAVSAAVLPILYVTTASLYLRRLETRVAEAREKNARIAGRCY